MATLSGSKPELVAVCCEVSRAEYSGDAVVTHCSGRGVTLDPFIYWFTLDDDLREIRANTEDISQLMKLTTSRPRYNRDDI